MKHEKGLRGYVHGHHSKVKKWHEINPNMMEGVNITVKMCKKCGFTTVERVGGSYNGFGVTWDGGKYELGYRNVNVIDEVLESLP